MWRHWNWLYEQGSSLNYDKIIRALQRNGWVVVRQRGSHVRLQKHMRDKVLKITVPAHKPVKRSTLSHILKQDRKSLCIIRETEMAAASGRNYSSAESGSN